MVHTRLRDAGVNETVKAFRIGKRSTANTKRPLKITLPNENIARSLIESNKNNDNINSHFKLDRTKSQQEFFKKVKLELEERKAKGEHNLCIRYNNDVPYVTVINNSGASIKSRLRSSKK